VNLVNTAAGAAGTLAGWAFSSLGMKVRPSFIQLYLANLFEQLAASDLQSTIATQTNLTLPSITGSTPGTPVPSFSHSSPSSSEIGGSKPKGMQLGGGHVSSTISHAAEWAAEAEFETSNPWGNDDLMDVNADQDDWSEMVFYPHTIIQMLTSDRGAFETAPVLGHETYGEQPVKAPLPVRAESKCFRARQSAAELK
jgi:SCY1-like protein 1